MAASYKPQLFVRCVRAAIFFSTGWERHLFVLATWIENIYQVFDFITLPSLKPDGINRYKLNTLRKKEKQNVMQEAEWESNLGPSVYQSKP